MSVAFPQSLIAGDSFSVTLAQESFSSTDGWVIRCRLTPRATGATVVQLVATGAGTSHRFAASAAQTSQWAPGAYAWAVWADRGAESTTLGGGLLEIEADPRQLASGADTRSTARKALDDLNIALAAWNPLRKSYTIGDRTMEFNSTAEIIKLINHWQLQVDAEDRTAGRKARMPRRIYTRL